MVVKATGVGVIEDLSRLSGSRGVAVEAVTGLATGWNVTGVVGSRVGAVVGKGAMGGADGGGVRGIGAGIAGVATKPPSVAMVGERSFSTVLSKDLRACSVTRTADWAVSLASSASWAMSRRARCNRLRQRSEQVTALLRP